MIVTKFENQENWLDARKGKITGTRLKDIVVKRGTGYKIGFYELIAEKLAIPESEFDGYIPNETPMNRGTRLQKYAMLRFEEETGKKVNGDIVMWSREDNSDIAISPDGVINDEEAVEVKCLASSRHVEAFLTQKVPDEYEFQALQYFIVNEKLYTLYFIFYDPRIPAKDFFYLTINRSDVEEDIVTYQAYQEKVLIEVEEIVKKLSPL